MFGLQRTEGACMHTCSSACAFSLIRSFFLLIFRGLGPWGPDLVRRYTSARFGSHSTGDVLSEEESTLFTGVILAITLIYIQVLSLLG